MLEAHLQADVEAASRKHDFIRRSAAWIAGQFRKAQDTKLLDLGCGPGIYAELFQKAGFGVTGIDFSKRSIAYAKTSAANKNLPIVYRYQNYLELDEQEAFDVVTLIYCDFGVLPPAERQLLLGIIKKALKPGGKLILDGFTKVELERFQEGRAVQFYETGFWAPEPYICIQSNYYYPQTENYLEQYVVITEHDCQCYNNWNQIYSVLSLKQELQQAGFHNIELFDNVAGDRLTQQSNTICAVAE